MEDEMASAPEAAWTTSHFTEDFDATLDLVFKVQGALLLRLNLAVSSDGLLLNATVAYARMLRDERAAAQLAAL